MKPLFLWIFFLIYPGHGHEDWSWLKFTGMVFLIAGTVFYIWLDMNHQDEEKIDISFQ